MQIEALTIERRPNYDKDYPSQLVGLVKLVSSLGSQEIRLTNASLSRIFAVIREQAASTAKQNAAMVPSAIENAMHEPLMATAGKIEEIPS